MDKAKIAILEQAFKCKFKTKGGKLLERRFVRVAVTPQTATLLLQLNIDNRPSKPRVIEHYAQQMSAGNWRYNPTDQRMIDNIGRLRNGQHTLKACVKSGKTIELDFIVGCDPDLFFVMDTGKNRGGGDILAIAGFKYSTVLAASTKQVLAIDQYGFSPAAFSGQGKRSNIDVLTFVQHNSAFVDNFDYVTSLYNSSDKLFTTTEIGALLWFFQRKDAKKAESFLYDACTGDGVAMGSPVFQLRRVFMRNQQSQYKLTRPSRFALIIKAWNFYLKGKTIKRLQFNIDKEKFPKPAK